MTLVDPSDTFYVLRHGKHSGFLVAKQLMESVGWPGISYFPNAEFVEFGWGDNLYYPNRGNRFALTVRAIAWPTPTVLHVVGIESKEAFFSERTIIRFSDSEATSQAVASYIANSFRNSPDGALIEEGRGLYGDSWFFSAKGYFHLFHTCNTWTAKGCRAAGLPVTPWYTVMASTLLKQISDTGEVIHNPN